MNPFTFIFLLYFAAIVVIKARIFRISGDKGGTLHDNWTFPVVFLSYLFVVMASLIEYFHSPQDLHLGLSMGGYVMATGGILITRKCVLTLGRWWSVRIETKKDHQIVEAGPYRISRHPYYLSTLLELGGLCLILNSFYTLIYLWLVHLPLLMARMVSEEKALRISLGALYLQYKKRVGVLPFLPGRWDEGYSK